MKIIIEHDNVTSSVDIEDFYLHEFTDHLRGLLHTVWLPSQVNDIMPNEETLSGEFAEVRRLSYEEGFDAGKEEGFDKGKECGYKEGLAFKGRTEKYKTCVADAYTKGNNDGYESGVSAMRAIYEPMLEAVDKDSKRLDWLLARISWLAFHQLGTRHEIDKAMTDKEYVEDVGKVPPHMDIANARGEYSNTTKEEEQ